MRLNPRQISDPQVRETVDAYMMLKSAAGYFQYAQDRVDKLTTDQIEAAQAYLMAIPQRELVELIFTRRP